MTSAAGRRTARRIFAGGTLIVLGALVGGCSPSTSSADPSGVAQLPAAEVSSTSSASPHPTGGPLAYSRCMREHGIPKFPDPGADGDLALDDSIADPTSATFQAADKACKPLMPVMDGKAPNQAKMLDFSRCMRAHGVKDFPDPAPGGGLMIKSEPGSDLDPSSPINKTATQACKKYAPTGRGGGTSTHIGGGAKR